MKIHETVRDFYSGVARGESASCCAPGCCATTPTSEFSLEVGYTPEQLAKIPAEANLGLGCGNPTQIAELKPGEVVVDLGSGAGIDCFLAADQVGEEGRVIGVDMTPSMVERAREAAAGYSQVEFRLGEIENLPISDGRADVVISNCVVNLSPHKDRVFDEVFRVLAPGGRVSISDIVAIEEVPAELRKAAEAVVGCVGNTALVDDVVSMLEASGFEEIVVEPKPNSDTLVDAFIPGASRWVMSATIKARKPQ